MCSVEQYGEFVAKYCDVVYEKVRDTQREIRFLNWVFQELADVEVREILDVACGTGRHAIPLSKKGYTVTGSDISQAMLAVLEEKVRRANIEIPVIKCDMKDIEFREEFDAIICMYTSFNYLLTDQDIEKALVAFHRALRPGGIAILDLMNPIFYIGKFREITVEHHQEGQMCIQRTFKHTLDEVRSLWYQDEFVVADDGNSVSTCREIHTMRMLTYPEISHFIRDAQFVDIKCYGNFTDLVEAEDKAERLILVCKRG
jgi:ubiquinone/menaquinone biosynthesis C-methylase UbiE